MLVITGSQTFESYHVFDMKQEYWPVLPKSHAPSGASVTISIEKLTVSSFVSGLQPFKLENREKSKWVSDSVQIESIRLEGRKLRIHVSQDRSPTNIGHFELNAILDVYPGRCNQYGGAYIQCHLTDYVGRTLPLRICHNGFDKPSFQVNRGSGFETVTLVSFDGYRLSIRYGFPGTTSTFYLSEPPFSAFLLKPPKSYSGAYLDWVQGMYRNAQIGEAVIKGRVGRAMFTNGSSYDQGRLGSEIAYVAAKRFLGLCDLVIEEPSKRGRDIFSKDQSVAIQARMIRSTPPEDLKESIQTEILSLARKVGRDYRYNPSMNVGYAILSFPATHGRLNVLVLEVLHPNEWRLDGRHMEKKPAEGSAPSTPRLRGA